MTCSRTSYLTTTRFRYNLPLSTNSPTCPFSLTSRQISFSRYTCSPSRTNRIEAVVGALDNDQW